MDGGLEYTATFTGTAVSAQLDFFEFLCPADAVLELREVFIGQESDAGDTESELLAYKIVKGLGTVTSGSGGSAANIGKRHSGFPAAGATVEALNTTKMVVGTGTLETWFEDTFHVAAGLKYTPLPETRPIISPGNRLTVELAKTPADALTFRGTAVFAEHGG